jgi:hypothetical protein
MNKHVARTCPYNGISRNSAIGATNPKKLWLLPLFESLKKKRVALKGALDPSPIG